MTDRDQDYDTKNTTPTCRLSYQVLRRAIQRVPGAVAAAHHRLRRRSRPRLTALTPNGGTNQPIGIAWGWQSLDPGRAAQCTGRRCQLHLQEGADRDVRRSEHPGSLAVIRQRPSPVQWRHRRPPENPVRQHQGRTASSSTRCMSTPTAIRPPPFCSIAPAAPDKFSTVTSVEPDHDGLHRDRHVALQAARREITATQSATHANEKSPALRPGFLFSCESYACARKR